MRKPYKTTRITMMIAAPIILLLLPPDYFDKGQSLCLSRTLFDTECYGCGMTRAVMHLVHLDLEQAWQYNKLSYIVTPLAILLWMKWLLAELRITILKFL